MSSPIETVHQTVCRSSSNCVQERRELATPSFMTRSGTMRTEDRTRNPTERRRGMEILSTPENGNPGTWNVLLAISNSNVERTQTERLNGAISNGHGLLDEAPEVSCSSPEWMGVPRHPIATISAISTENAGQDDRLDLMQVEAPCTSGRVDEVTNDDVVEEPKSGMEFDSFEDLQSYYKKYAKKEGFGMKIQRSERSEDKNIRYITLGCVRVGKPQGGGSNPTNPRPTGKTDCKARINATRVNGKMKLTTVNNTHNHGLSPRKSRFFRCNREVSEAVKRVLDTNDIAGVSLIKSYGTMVVGADGYENLPFTEKDCRNYIYKARQERLGAGGAGALQEYFLRMQFKNDGFFSLMELDDEGRLKNVFWADPRSRAAYKYFGDVVTFDTTYLTNRYDMPFAPFVGVNHHGQSILLGAALISSETTETFTWLFRTWLQCMDGIAPKAVITDQDRAMKNAIAAVFPETRHRFCMWHILKKVPEKLGSYAVYKSIRSHLNKCVYETQTIEEFDECWAELIEKYDLHENVWLKSLPAEREHWIPVFQKEVFWAGMSSTQRSESMNAFFDGYVHSKTNLKEFVDQYDNALRKKFENENSADFQSFSTTVPCISRCPVEKKFQDVYTIAKFKEVQQEVVGRLNCDLSQISSDDTRKMYSVEDEIHLEEFSRSVTYFVDFNKEDRNATCSCGLFQMRGIPCRHILAVFRSNGIKNLPGQYILDRWRKDIKRRYTSLQLSSDVRDQRPNGIRHSILLSMCYHMIPYAVDATEHFEEAKKRIQEMTEYFRSNPLPPSPALAQKVTNMAPNEGGGNSQQVKSPLVARAKGRPPSLRKVGRMEKALQKAKSRQKQAPANRKRKQLEVDNNDSGEVQAVEGDSLVFYQSGTQQLEPMFESQESMHFGIDGSQPMPEGCDGSQP